MAPSSFTSLTFLQPNFVYPSAVDNFKRQFAHLEAGGRGQANPHLGQATSLPRERVSEFRSEAAKYLAAQGRSTQHMSGVAAATAYGSQGQTVVGGPAAAAAQAYNAPVGAYGAPLPAAAYPYGSSVDMEGAVEMVSGGWRAGVWWWQSVAVAAPWDQSGRRLGGCMCMVQSQQSPKSKSVRWNKGFLEKASLS